MLTNLKRISPSQYLKSSHYDNKIFELQSFITMVNTRSQLGTSNPAFMSGMDMVEIDIATLRVNVASLKSSLGTKWQNLMMEI